MLFEFLVLLDYSFLFFYPDLYYSQKPTEKQTKEN